MTVSTRLQLIGGGHECRFLVNQSFQILKRPVDIREGALAHLDNGNKNEDLVVGPISGEKLLRYRGEGS